MEVILIVFMVIAVLAAVFGIGGAVKKTSKLRQSYKQDQAQEAKLKAAGAIVDRGKHAEFFTQEHMFTTTVGELSRINAAINHAMLKEAEVTTQTAYDKGAVVFQQGGQGGSFRAVLRSLGKDGELFRYQFKVESYTGIRVNQYQVTNQLSLKDVLGANVLLTAIERAVLSLDSNADVQRSEGTYKTTTR